MPSLALKFVFSLTHVYTVLAYLPISPVIEQRFRCHHCHFNTLLDMKKGGEKAYPELPVTAPNDRLTLETLLMTYDD